MPHRSQRAPASGFTLLELMVVIVVLGILAALIVPEFKGTYEAAVLSSSARDVVGVLRLARSQAVTTGKPVRFRWQAAKHAFVLESEVESAGATRSSGSEPQFAALERVPGASGMLEPQVRLHAQEPRQIDRTSEPGPSHASPDQRSRKGSVEIEFRPDGTAEAAEIHLSDDSGARLVLEVLPATGRIAERRNWR